MNFDSYIANLSDILNPDSIEFAENNIYRYAKQVIILNKDNKPLFPQGKAEAVTMIAYITEVSKSEAKIIYEIATSINILEELRTEMNILSDRVEAKVDNKTMTIYTPLSFNDTKKDISEDVGSGKYEEFISEYKKFMPIIDELLDLIIYNYISPQKNSYINIVAPAGAGKSLLAYGLENAGIGLVIDDFRGFVENTSASPISVAKLSNSMVIIDQEFKYFHESYKNITHNIKIAEKFQPTKNVKIGVKLFFNANLSESFSDGVDEQLVDRLVTYNLSDKLTKITEKEWFNKVGGYKAVRYLAYYIEEYVKAKLSSLSNRGDIYEYCDKEYRRLTKKEDRVIKAESIDTAMNEAIIEAINMPHEQKAKAGIEDAIIYTDEGIFLKRPKKTLKAIFELVLTPNKAKHYMSYIENFITKNAEDYRRRPKNIFGKATKGVLLKRIIKVVEGGKSEYIVL
jgi:hypothetical protein